MDSPAQRAIIFAGPSLPPAARPSDRALEWRPPVRQGEVYAAAVTGPAMFSARVAAPQAPSRMRAGRS